MTTNTIQTNSRVRLTKGCKPLNLTKGSYAQVLEVKEMGADYGHFVRVTLRIAGKTYAMWSRHKNRLSDAVVRLHNGDPHKHIELVLS